MAKGVSHVSAVSIMSEGRTQSEAGGKDTERGRRERHRARQEGRTQSEAGGKDTERGKREGR